MSIVSPSHRKSCMTLNDDSGKPFSINASLSYCFMREDKEKLLYNRTQQVFNPDGTVYRDADIASGKSTQTAYTCDKIPRLQVLASCAGQHQQLRVFCYNDSIQPQTLHSHASIATSTTGYTNNQKQNALLQTRYCAAAAGTRTRMHFPTPIAFD